MTLETATTTLEHYAVAHGTLELTDNVRGLCASCAFLAFVECGGTDLDQFEWAAPNYLEVAYRVLRRQLRGRSSDWYDQHQRETLRRQGVTAPGCGAWTWQSGVDLTAFEARDAVELLRTRLPRADFELLDALCLQGYTIREYVPIWVSSGAYRGRLTLQHSENALSKRYRTVLRAARQCLAGAV